MKTVFSSARLAVLPLALAAAFPSLAQTQLKEVVVTATRVATRADALSSEVLVIDREDIERSAGRTLTEVLARLASVQLSSNGGRGNNSNIFIRGTEARHTLLLIDGVRYGSATAGTPVWDNLPLDQIERIEVLKGPASALYGADAVGGVVQIFTVRGAPGLHPTAEVTLGSHGYRAVSAGVQAGTDTVRYSLGGSVTRDRGFSATNPSVPFGSYNPDRDGFDQKALNGSVDWTLAPDWTLNAGVLYSEGTQHFDDGLGADTASALRSSVLRAGLSGKISPTWTTRFNFAQGVDRSEALVSASSFNLPGLFETTQNKWTWQNDIQTGVGTVVAGLETLEQKVNSSQAYSVNSRRINAAFAGLTGKAGAHGWQLNARRDDNSQFGAHSTGYAGYSYQINPAWRAHAGYGTSFVAPNFNDLYWKSSYYNGNPLLQPEQGKNAELGLDWTQGDHHVKLVRFDNRIRGFISGGTSTVNVPRVRIDGWTLGYDGHFDALNLWATAEALDPRNTANQLQLRRRAKSQLSLGGDYTLGAWRLGGSALYVGQRFEDAANTTRLGAYATADVSLAYTVDKDWTVQTKLNNLTNRQYATALGYNQPGRELFVSLRYQPK
ncbi:TonB-dependent receptor [Rhodoferax sp. WC2427]|uniref:TonB-dependent receptor domain-containing protein n=1 Tax=Rhodoferax sp. WC2427 TaxID=3234144 RepID=UPI0034659C6F